jgi:predicted SprT family Zn-dependent metalloprotease
VNLSDAATLARSTMRQHGFGHVTFEFDRSKRRFGSVQWRGDSPHKLTLSEHLVRLNPREVVMETILHETAHLLAGRDAGHGPVWRAHARRLGIKGDRCYDATNTVTPPAPHNARCGCTTHKRYRAPRPGAKFRCRKCGVVFRYERGPVHEAPVLVAANEPPRTLDEWRARRG